MRIIKLGIISAIFFALLITAFSLLIPSHIRISKATDIQTSKDSLLKQLADPSQWKNWYPGADTMQLVMENGKPTGMQIAPGQGSIKIGEISDSVISTVIEGSAVRRSSGGWNIYDGSRPNTITVQWFMDFNLKWYPWEKFSSLLLEKRYGPMMEKALDKLKSNLENQVER